MDSNYFERLLKQPENGIFNDRFRLVSYHTSEQGRLVGVEIAMRFDGSDNDYLLSVQTFGHFAERTEMSEEDAVEQTASDDQAYVLAVDEIFPSDISALRETSFDVLEPFLIPQETD